MSTSHFLRLKTIAGGGKFLAALRHNKRTNQNERGSAAHINAALTCHNYALLGLATPEAVTQHAKNMRLNAGIEKVRKNGVLAIEVVFSLPVNSLIDHHAYFTACVNWAAQQFGADNLLSADVHLDEAAPHCQMLVLPLRNGRMQGDAIMGDRQTMLDRQAHFFEHVASVFGFVKQQLKPRMCLADKQSLVATVCTHIRQTADQCQQSPAWALIRDLIEEAPTRWAECYGLELEHESKPKRMRTVAEIFTSKGKGAKTEREDANNQSRDNQKPYRGLAVKSTNPYVSVGVSQPNAYRSVQTNAYKCEQPNDTKHNETQISAPKNASRNEQKRAGNEGLIDQVETVRVRDDRIKADYFDPETGEFHEPVVKVAGLRRLDAENYVRSALGNIGKFSRNAE